MRGVAGTRGTGEGERRDGRNCDQGVEDIIKVEKPTPPCHQEIMPDSSN